MRQVRITYLDGSTETFPSDETEESIRAAAEASAQGRGTAIKNIGFVTDGRYLGVMGCSRPSIR